MTDFDTLEDTLFVPMLGRIYAGKHFPHILSDAKAMELEEKLPQNVKGKNTQTQYTLMAGAVRSANMDRYISDFLGRNPNGMVAELGCGLETAFYRNDDGKTLWYEIDLPNVIAFRKRLLGSENRDHLIETDAFQEEWIKKIRKEHPQEPLLITASGLLYYFEQEKVLELFRSFQKYGPIEVVFDTVNAAGMKQMGRYMKQVGHADAAMYFYVDSGADLAQKVGAELLAEEPYYCCIPKKGMQFVTRMTMRISDLFKMVKMIHLRFEDQNSKRGE